MSFRLQIASTYKREVTVEVPGKGLKPEKVKITAVFHDVDTDTIETDQQLIQTSLSTLMGLVQQMRGDQKPSDEKLAQAEEEIQGIGELTPKIDRILAGIELPTGAEVVGRDGTPLAGSDLTEFAKRYPRWKQAILKRWDEENESAETAQLGNLRALAGRGRG